MGEEYEAELTQGLSEGGELLRRNNTIAAERRNEEWLQKKWDDAIEELLKKYRLQYDTGEMSIAECDEADNALRTRFKELCAAYVLEAVGPIAAREEPRERLLDSRSNAALREMAAWRGRAVALAEAKAAAERAGTANVRKLHADSKECPSKNGSADPANVE